MPRDASVFVHERALCESDDVGAGTRVHAFAHVMRGASIGRDCNICGHAFVESGARIGDRVTVKNNVMVWDKVVVGNPARQRGWMCACGEKLPRDLVCKCGRRYRPCDAGLEEVS